MNRKRTEIRSPTSPCPTVHQPPPAKRHCTGMSISTTRNEPAHYMLKVESFSILSENPSIKIESDVFEASNNKWKLELHPCGNEVEEVAKVEEGANYVALYLICDTQHRPAGWNVLADVKFFVYDHIAQNYVTFQDVDGNRTMFNEKQNKWGFDNLISLDNFKDSGKGYIFNDAFVFGVEVFVVPEYTLNDRCLSITKPPATMNTYSWTVDNFSAIKSKPPATMNTYYPYSTVNNSSAIKSTNIKSEVFKVGKVKWYLLLSHNGNGTGAGTNLSCLLGVHEAHSFPSGWRIYAKFELRVKNQSGYADRVQETDKWFCGSAIDSGFPCFMPLNELCDTKKGFLLNDRLIVEAKILLIGIQKNFV